MVRRPLIPILLSFIGGILIGHFFSAHIRSITVVILLLISGNLVFLIFFAPHCKYPAHITLFLFIGILLTIYSDKDSRLLTFIKQGESVILEGTVLQPARRYKDLERFYMRAEKLIINHEIKSLDEHIQVSVYNPVRDSLPGERIRLPAKIRPFRNFNNPGRFNYELSMKVKGITCNASVPDGRRIVPMGKGTLNPVILFLETIRRPIRELFRERLSAKNQALYMALILGERQGITPALREPFNRAGLGHILAVSGLHIGLIAWLVFFVSKRLLLLSYNLSLKTDIHKLAAIITCLPVVAYTFLSGLHVSGQRAMIMVLAYLFSIIINREKDIWSTLSLAALIVLALDPNELFSISFQLSFIAVTGILLLSPVLLKKVSNPFGFISQMKILKQIYLYFAGMIVVTFSAILFLIPITSFYFHQVSIVSIFANITVIPFLGFWVIPLGLLSSMFVYFTPGIAGFFIEAGSWGLELIMHIMEFWTRPDWSFFRTVTPNLFEIILFYGLILFLIFMRYYPWLKIGIMVILVIIVADISFWVYETSLRRDLRVTYLDVGQGNSALIQFPGKKRMIIDGGGFYRSEFDAGKMIVAPYLWYRKIRSIDYMVLSHPQSDHMGGLNFIAANFSPKEFWYNGDVPDNPMLGELLEVVKSKGINIFLPENLTAKRDIGGVEVRLLHPMKNPSGESVKSSRQLNNNSLVLRLSYKGRSFLFPGDLEADGEKNIIRVAGQALDGNILLAPHHGSRGSCSEQFLEAVSPEICVISSGKNNYFGFPHQGTLERLESIGCRIMRIDQTGSIQIILDQDGLQVKSYIRPQKSSEVMSQ